jgi:hypothetical protein
VLRRVALTVLVAIVAGACNSNEKPNPGPTGRPDDVVRAAPDITLRTGTARVVGAAPGISATGTVTFETGEDRFEIAGRGKGKTPPFGVVHPAAVIDLLRGVVNVEPYGGAEVQGVGTKRYDVDIDLSKAITWTPKARRDDLELLVGQLGKDNKLWAAVFIDSVGRVRRVLLPVQTASERPYGDDKHIPQMVSVDYSDFGGDE